MLFVLWFQFDPDHIEQVREMWKRFAYPDGVKVIGRYVLIGRHMSIAIFDAPDEASLLKITGPFSSFGVAHIAPAVPIDEANQVTW
ncbi:MAG: DUF3303 domain-containing protein [Halobacteriota archaeon]